MRDRPIVTPGLVIGFFALAAGITLLLDRQGILEAHEVFKFFWPSVLLAFGLFRLAQPSDAPGRVWGAILTIAGIALLLDQLGYVHLTFSDVWPILLILIGLMFVWRAIEAGRGRPRPRSLATVNAVSAFGGGELRSDAKDFQGGDVLTVFGGYDLDLRQASMQENEAVLYANTVFGGIEIRVPEAWAVSLRGIPILGGYADKTHHPMQADGAPAQHLIVKGFAIFGGVEVKN